MLPAGKNIASASNGKAIKQQYRHSCRYYLCYFTFYCLASPFQQGLRPVYK